MRRIFETTFVIVLSSLSSYATSEESNPLLMAVPDYAAREAAAAKEVAEMNKQRSESFAAMANEAFSPTNEIIGGDCLSAIKRLNITTFYTSIDYPNIDAGQFIKDSLLNMSCDAMTSALNEQIEKINSSINSFGDALNENSGGIIDINSNTNDSGDFSASFEQTRLQDNEIFKQATVRAQEELSSDLFGNDDLSSSIDISDPAYQNEPNKESPTSESFKINRTEISDNVICGIMGCDE